MLGTLEQARNGDISALAVIAILAMRAGLHATSWCSSRAAQRRITVNYARRQGGRSAYMNQSSFLPLKLNMSGVIPPIFASSIIMFPATATDVVRPGGKLGLPDRLQKITQALSPGEPLHMILYAALIVGFTFFYTALVFNSQETADNLKKSGALIPGIRPGKATADYIDAVLTRLTGGRRASTWCWSACCRRSCAPSWGRRSSSAARRC